MLQLNLGFQTDKPLADYGPLAALAEAAGFDVVSVYNDLFFQPPWLPLLLMAQHTQRVRLGPAAVNPFTYHPIALAGDLALLDEASAGRAYFGIARGAWLDEAGQDGFGLGAWEAVLRRLSLSQGPVLITTTPYNLGWLKSQVYDRWRAGDPDYLVVQADSTVNPAFPQAELERARRDLPTWKFNMFYRGQFGRPAGMIYGDFDETLHIVDDFPLSREWPRYVGLDFGANNTALVWLAHDTERDAFYLYRESLEGGKTTPQHAAQARAHAATERVVWWCGGARSEVQYRRDWTAAGVSVVESPIVDVEAGIDRVVQLIKQQRLYVFRSCVGVLDELGRYSRVVDESGQATEKIKDKETFHRLDALRYVVGRLLGHRAVEIL